MTTTQAPAELTTAQTKALDALTAHPGATAKEIAEHAGIGGSTAGKALPHLESLNLAHREHGENVGGRGGRRTADRWYPVTADAEPETPAAAEPETPAEDTADTAPTEAPVAETKAGTGSRLGRGDLRQMVYEHLAAHPADEIGPSGLAKTLGRSAGAVANALAKLTGQGQAELVSDSPRRYRLK
ncbi:helix-turn-helix domain-containing protein [Streptomyces sp. IBSBF 2950]|uniref:helix-turn-helix domain-containing protein n=1 Tax=Streptomyces sp. IBSBF 2950 TaxID=2903528 RepID=UPI002FDC2833